MDPGSTTKNARTVTTVASLHVAERAQRPPPAGVETRRRARSDEPRRMRGPVLAQHRVHRSHRRGVVPYEVPVLARILVETPEPDLRTMRPADGDPRHRQQPFPRKPGRRSHVVRLEGGDELPFGCSVRDVPRVD